MNVFEVGDRFNKINECINAVIVLLNRPNVHGLDKALLEQERDELIRAYHDTLREFEDECVKRGREQAIERIDKALIYDQNERMSITKARLSEIVR